MGWKFAAAVGAVVVGVAAVSATSVVGLVRLRSDIERLTTDDLADIRTVGDVALGLYVVEDAALAELATGGTPRDRRASCWSARRCPCSSP